MYSRLFCTLKNIIITQLKSVIILKVGARGNSTVDRTPNPPRFMKFSNVEEIGSFIKQSLK